MAKKVLKIVGGVLGALVLIVVIYVVYVMASYYRLDDSLSLESVLLKRVTRQACAGSGNENGGSAPFGSLARRAIVAWARKGL